MHKKVSVVIPMFNAEEFIGETLRSVIEQSYSNLEIILVDDGSTDATLSIVNDFLESNKDNRFFLYEKDNAGVSSARNLGIKKSSGIFLFFLDSDDIIGVDFIYELISAHAKNNFNDIISAENIYDYHKDGSFNQWKKNRTKELFYSRNFVYVWGKLYSRDFLVRNDIKFDDDLAVGEDFHFNSQCAFYKAKFFSIDNDSKFLYRVHAGSLSNNRRLIMDRFKSSSLIFKTINMIKGKERVAITVFLNGFLVLLLKCSIRNRDFIFLNNVCNLSFSSKEIKINPNIIMKSDLSIKNKIISILSYYYYCFMK